MGLDTVELVMEVEETFGIEIPIEAAQEIVTVGDLFEFVKSQTELAPAGTCLTAATFYDLRKGLHLSGIDQRFGPSTRLDEILPCDDRRSFWARLAEDTELRLPKLVRPSWAVYTSVGATLLVSLVISRIVADQIFSGYMFRNHFYRQCGCAWIYGGGRYFATRYKVRERFSDISRFVGTRPCNEHY